MTEFLALCETPRFLRTGGPRVRLVRSHSLALRAFSRRSIAYMTFMSLSLTDTRRMWSYRYRICLRMPMFCSGPLVLDYPLDWINISTGGMAAIKDTSGSLPMSLLP